MKDESDGSVKALENSRPRRQVLKIVGAGVIGAALSPFAVACQEARATRGAAFPYFNGYFFVTG